MNSSDLYTSMHKVNPGRVNSVKIIKLQLINIVSYLMVTAKEFVSQDVVVYSLIILELHQESFPSPHLHLIYYSCNLDFLQEMNVHHFFSFGNFQVSYKTNQNVGCCNFVPSWYPL